MEGKTILLKEAKKYIQIYFVIVKNCLIAQMEYRANFFMSLAVECGYLCARILYVIIIYQTGVSIGGLTPDKVLLIIGTHSIITGVYVGLFVTGFYRFSNSIRTGMLDLYMTKPISLMFIVTLRYFDFGLSLPEIISGILMITIGWKRLNIPVTFLSISGFIGIIISGILITYFIFLLPQLLSFWFVKTNSIYGIMDQVWEFNNMPMGIYNKIIQRVGTFIFPIFVISNYPVMFLLHKLTLLNILWVFLAPILFLGIVRFVWKSAIRNYTSASS